MLYLFHRLTVSEGSRNGVEMDELAYTSILYTTESLC